MLKGELPSHKDSLEACNYRVPARVGFQDGAVLQQGFRWTATVLGTTLRSAVTGPSGIMRRTYRIRPLLDGGSISEITFCRDFCQG